MIRYRCPDRKLKKTEKWFHIIPLSFGIVTAIIPAAFKLYNPTGWNCWISTDYKDPDDTRKDAVQAFQLAFFYVPLWVTIIVSGRCMFMIYLYVRETELRTAGSSVVSSRLARTKQVAFQGMYFVAALILTWCIPSIVRVMQMAGGSPPRALILLGGITAPSQGFLNSLAYFRIRAKRQMLENPNTSKWRIVAGIVWTQFFPWWKPAGSLEDNGNECEAKIDQSRRMTVVASHIETGAAESSADRRGSVQFQLSKRATSRRSSTPLYPGSDWNYLRARGVNTISLVNRDMAHSELEIVKEGGVHEEELSPNGFPTSESQG